MPFLLTVISMSLGNGVYSNRKIVSHHQSTNRNGKSFLGFATEHKLCILNIKFQKNNIKLLTFEFANGRSIGRHNWTTINRKWKKAVITVKHIAAFQVSLHIATLYPAK